MRARGAEFSFGAYICGPKNYAIGDSRMCIFVRIKISCAPINKTHQLDCARNVEESRGGSSSGGGGKTVAPISQRNQKQNKKKLLILHLLSLKTQTHAVACVGGCVWVARSASMIFSITFHLIHWTFVRIYTVHINFDQFHSILIRVCVLCTLVVFWCFCFWGGRNQGISSMMSTWLCSFHFQCYSWIDE